MTIKRLQRLNEIKEAIVSTMLFNPTEMAVLLPTLLELMDFIMEERFKIIECCGNDQKLFKDVMKIKV